MTTFLESVREIVEANDLILVRRVSIPDSSEPLIKRYSAPTSLHSALATVVFPIPGPPAKRKLGSSPELINCLNVSFSSFVSIQSLIVCGRYFSTHRYSFIIYFPLQYKTIISYFIINV